MPCEDIRGPGYEEEGEFPLLTTPQAEPTSWCSGCQGPGVGAPRTAGPGPLPGLAGRMGLAEREDLAPGKEDAHSYFPEGLSPSTPALPLPRQPAP